MNILAIPSTYGLYKPISGGQSRFLNLTKALKNGGHKIVVLETHDLRDPRDEKLARVYSYKDFRLFNRKLIILRDLNIDFILKLLQILRNERIDLIEVTYPSGTLAARIITRLTGNRIPMVYNAHNVEADFLMETFASNRKYSRLERFILPKYIEFSERFLCKHVIDHIIAVSNEDRESFVKRYKVSEEKVSVSHNGSHIFPLSDEKCKNDAKRKVRIDSDRLIIFFHGLFTHPPNKEAFEIIESYIAPRFEKTNGKVLFVVGGTGVPKFERANIRSLGFMEDLHKTMAMADIAIVPLTKGAGTKLKVLDYLGAGLPIVTTKKGIEGINTKNYEHAIIVNDVNEEFINAIKYLIDNEEERKRIGANARKLAEEKYDWEKIGKKLDKLYREILAKKDVTALDEQLGD